MASSISIIMPAFNEEENIKKAVTDINSHIKTKFKKYEIIVVNNGSQDKTKSIVENLIKNNKHVILINIKKNIGYGKGLRTGFENAKNNLIFYTDADNQFEIKELNLLMPLIEKFDIVCGYRKDRQDPKMRIIIANVYNFIIRLLFNLKVKDIDCSFKIYRKEIFDKIKLQSDTGLIDAEILIKAKKAGYTISPQIAVTHYPRFLGRTTYELGPRSNFFAFIRPGVIIEILKEIKKLWGDLR